MDCIRQGCGKPREEHDAFAPHGLITLETQCVGYQALYPCESGQCAGGQSDCELHEPTAPHPRNLTGCPAVQLPSNWPSDPSKAPPFQGGGGSSGGGGASGTW